MPLEILVSDNSEDSRTAELIKSYNLILPINYIQQSQNIGACNNFIYSVSASKGSYCWILGDDDLIAQGSIARLLRILTLEPDIPGIVVGYSYQDEKSRPKILSDLCHQNASTFELPNFISLDINQLVTKWEDTFLLTKLNALHTSILSCVFSRELWMKHIAAVVNTISAKDESISDEFESLFTTFPHTTTWARMFVGNPVYVISQPMAYLFYGEQEWLSKWPAIMFTRCLDLAAFFEQLGGDPVAVRYYKSLIMKDPSLHDLILANDAYTKHIFCLQKLISSNPDSKELLKNIGILLGREEIPLRSKISIVINLLRGGNPLKTLYRFMNSQDFREGSLAHYSLSIFSRGVRMVSSFRGYGRN
jgi:Glycosyl transferase family 2